MKSYKEFVAEANAVIKTVAVAEAMQQVNSANPVWSENHQRLRRLRRLSAIKNLRNLRNL